MDDQRFNLEGREAAAREVRRAVAQNERDDAALSACLVEAAQQHNDVDAEAVITTLTNALIYAVKLYGEHVKSDGVIQSSNGNVSFVLRKGEFARD